MISESLSPIPRPTNNSATPWSSLLFRRSPHKWLRQYCNSPFCRILSIACFVIFLSAVPIRRNGTPGLTKPLGREDPGREEPEGSGWEDPCWKRPRRIVHNRRSATGKYPSIGHGRTPQIKFKSADTR